MPISGGGGGGGSSSGGGFSSGGMHTTGTGFNNYNYGMENHNYGHNSGRGPRRGRGSGLFAIIIRCIIILVIAGSLVFDFLDLGDSPDTEYVYSELVDDENYTAVTTRKEKLDESLCEKTENYLYDSYQTGFIKKPKKLAEAFENFYNMTGIEPCLYITDDPYEEDYEQLAYDKYLELFNDEGHLLIYFYANPDFFEYSYHLMIGTDTAEDILDEPALSNLRVHLNSLGKNDEIYDDVSDSYDYTDELCSALTESIDEIMTRTEYVPIETESLPTSKPTDAESVSTLQPVPTEVQTNANSSGELISLSGAFSVILIITIIVVALVGIILISKARNNTKLDEYHSDRTDNDYSLDDYDEQFKKRESKYDDFSRR